MPEVAELTSAPSAFHVGEADRAALLPVHDLVPVEGPARSDGLRARRDAVRFREVLHAVQVVAGQLVGEPAPSTVEVRWQDCYSPVARDSCAGQHPVDEEVLSAVDEHWSEASERDRASASYHGVVRYDDVRARWELQRLQSEVQGCCARRASYDV